MDIELENLFNSIECGRVGELVPQDKSSGTSQPTPVAKKIRKGYSY